MLSCSQNLLNVGRSDCKLNVSALVGFIKVPSDFSIPVADLADATELQAAILADKSTRIYMFPTGVDFVDNSEEAQIEETPLGKSIFIRDGQYRWSISFNENFELFKAMYSHNNTSGAMIFIDKDGKMLYRSTDNNTNAKGIDIDLFLIEKLKIDGAAASTKEMVSVRLTNSKQISVQGELLDVSDWIDDVAPLTTVDVKLVGTATASNVVVTVTSSLDGRGLSGLVPADFADSTIGTITTATPDAAIAGQYDLAGTFTDGDVQLIAASLLSVPGFEQDTPLAITGI